MVSIFGNELILKFIHLMKLIISGMKKIMIK